MNNDRNEVKPCTDETSPAHSTAGIATGHHVPNAPVDSEAAPTSNPEAAADIELARICEPHGEKITAYLRANSKIAANQDWRSMSAEYAGRVKRNPAGFLKKINGEAVAA